MGDSFLPAFWASFGAQAEVFLIVLAAGLLVRAGVVTHTHISALSRVTVDVFLPCMIFANVLANLDPARQPFWWVLPLVAIGMSGLALGLAALAFRRDLPAKRNMLGLTAFQNAGYLVLPIGLALYPAEFDTFALYCFLFLLGMNPLLWSLGNWLVTTGRAEGGHPARRGKLPGWVTPPMLASLSAIGLVLSGAGAYLPDPITRPMHLLGTAAVPTATFILGAVLGSLPVRLQTHWSDAARVLAIKLWLLPAVTAVTLRLLDGRMEDPLLARFLVIEAAVAPATSILLQIRSYGGDEVKVGSLMLLAYGFCAVSLPLWVAAWEALPTWLLATAAIPALLVLVLQARPGRRRDTGG